MAKAIWNGTVIAESEQTVVVEGNHYFPESSIKPGTLEPSDTTSVCGWKGTANYCNVVAGGETNADAAWVYRDPKDAASEIQNHFAFWKGVQVEA